MRNCFTFQVYEAFFTLIKSKIGQVSEIEINIDEDISFGSDQEKALINALKNVFPNSKQYLCILHLEKNFNRFLEKLDESKQVKKMLWNAMFGHKGTSLAESKNDKEFSSRYDEINKINLKKDDSRFIHKFCKTLYDYVLNPKWDDGLEHSFTNNNAESCNHVIKNYIN